MFLCYKIIILAAFVLSLLSMCTHAEEFPECDLVETGKFIAVQNDCASYVYCDGDLSFLDTCPEESYFDAKHEECVFDNEHVCLRVPATDEQLVSGGNATEATIESTTVRSSTQILHVGRPICVQGNDGYYAHTQRCEYYYHCLGGYLSIMRCSFSYAWDHLLEVCVPMAAARCFTDSTQ